MILGIIVLLVIIALICLFADTEEIGLISLILAFILVIVYIVVASANKVTSIVSADTYIISKIQVDEADYYLIEKDKGVYTFTYTDDEGNINNHEISKEDIIEVEGLEIPQFSITITKNVANDKSINFWFPQPPANEKPEYKVIVPSGMLTHTS